MLNPSRTPIHRFAHHRYQVADRAISSCFNRRDCVKPWCLQRMLPDHAALPHLQQPGTTLALLA